MKNHISMEQGLVSDQAFVPSIFWTSLFHVINFFYLSECLLVQFTYHAEFSLEGFVALLSTFRPLAQSTFSYNPDMPRMANKPGMQTGRFVLNACKLKCSELDGLSGMHACIHTVRSKSNLE